MRTIEQLRRSDQLAKEMGERDAHEYLRSREAADGRTKEMTFEARVFTERQGIPIHWTVSGEDVGELEGNVNDLIEWLDVNEFGPHTGFGQTSAPAAPRQTPRSQAGPQAHQRPKPQPQRASVNAVKCIYCGGATWDNTGNKTSPKSPDFKCKNKTECGGAAWLQEGGELSWSAN